MSPEEIKERKREFDARVRAGRPMCVPLDAIPALNLRAEQVKQAANRELDFLGRLHDICGIKIRTMTVLDFCLLTHKGSPLLYRINPTLADLSLFMAVLMPGKRSLLRLWRMGRRCRKLNLEQWALRCFEYVEQMMADFPAGQAGGESFVSFVAYWCHAIQKTYHCDRATVLAMSLPELCQRLRLIKQDANPGAPEGNSKTDGMVNQILNDLNSGKFAMEDLPRLSKLDSN